MHPGRLLVILCIMIPLSCCAGDPSSPGEDTPSAGMPGYPQRGVVHGGSILSWDSETIAEAARGRILIAPIEFCFAPAARHGYPFSHPGDGAK